MDTVDKIFDLLTKTGMEQQQFASLLGIQATVVSNWRKRKLKSYQKYLPQIAEVLGTTVEYLVTGNTPPSRSADNKKPALEIIESGVDPMDKYIMDMVKELPPETKKIFAAQLEGIIKSRKP